MTSSTKKEEIRRKYRRKAKKAGESVQKREETLYVRVKPLNKNFVAGRAKKAGVSESEFVDLVLDGARGA